MLLAFKAISRRKERGKERKECGSTLPPLYAALNSLFALEKEKDSEIFWHEILNCITQPEKQIYHRTLVIQLLFVTHTRHKLIFIFSPLPRL